MHLNVPLGKRVNFLVSLEAVFLLVKVKVTESCLTLCDPMD